LNDKGATADRVRTPRGLRVGPWTLDPELETVRGSDGELNLDALPRRVLFALAKAPGRHLDKDALAAIVWPGRDVSDAMISQTIYRLRTALGDRHHRWIEVVRHRGYRLSVESQDADSAAPSALPDVATSAAGASEAPAMVPPDAPVIDPSEAVVDRSKPSSAAARPVARPLRRDLLRASVAGVLLAGLGVLVSRGVSSRRTPPAGTPLAVLLASARQAIESYRADDVAIALPQIEEALEATPRSARLQAAFADLLNIDYEVGATPFERLRADALPAAERAVALDPASFEGYAALGLTYANLESVDRAVAAYQQAVALAPDQPILWFRLGNGLTQKFRLHDALRAFERSQQLRPGFAKTPLASAFTRALTGEHDPAAFDASVQAMPDYAYVAIEAAMSSTWAGDLVRARRLLEDALARDPNHAWLIALSAECAIAAGAREHARALLARVATIALDADPYVWMGLLGVTRSLGVPLAPALERAVLDSPRRTGLEQWCAAAALELKGDPEAAHRSASAAYTLDREAGVLLRPWLLDLGSAALLSHLARTRRRDAAAAGALRAELVARLNDALGQGLRVPPAQAMSDSLVRG